MQVVAVLVLGSLIAGNSAQRNLIELRDGEVRVLHRRSDRREPYGTGHRLARNFWV